MTAQSIVFDLDRYWHDETHDHLNAAQMTFATLRPALGQWLDACAAAIESGNKIMFFGNGGSAADAQHLATELSVRFMADRAPIAALSLPLDTSSMTAIGNDLGFDHLFSRHIDALGVPGDIAVGLTTSGNSPNVLKALWSARDRGIVTVGLSGGDGGRLHDVCDILLIVPATSTRRIQEMHITLGHMLCGALEQTLGLF